MLSLNEIKEYFPQIGQKYNEQNITYLDSAATNLKYKGVIELTTDYYAKTCASVHRGVHSLSEFNTNRYEQTRKSLQEFLNASSDSEIVFTKGTTDSINLVARTWGDQNIQKDDEILISELEHHSNIVPWQMLCERTGAKLKIAPINDKGEIRQEEYKKLINSKTKLISIVYISNALGTINPIKEMIEIAKTENPKIKFLVDAAQASAHLKLDVKSLDCDFLAISAHKMFGPTGVGVLYGKQEILESMPPLQGGGDMIDVVTFEKTTYTVPPQKFEAGTPDIAGIIAWSEAIKFINQIGLDKIFQHEHTLLTYATEQMQEIDKLHIIGTAKEKSAVISFVIDGLHPHDIATLANKYGLALRTGHHCTQPLMKRLGVPATARASFSIYNTKEDVDHLVTSLKKIIDIFCE
ncbi:MAG: cysteine desulfurase [Bacteriovoracaceae bacterium]|jgi:cysteine desulfurase/selenocysteine lyase|nr:cysteine desulfurase CsdA [Halobacteriovoraceae bacterium]MDP7321471.1 cysteine desulfurase [Bacteriovoracaceae bacterium]|tara:strand:- start:1211 stop:2437 length:1227 start_codon:yes stop_codon:yes gene_type:complete